MKKSNLNEKLKELHYRTPIIMCIALVIAIVAVVVLLVGCGYNKQVFDFDYKFDTAIIEGVGEVNIKSWNDYENSDMIQVTTTDGKVYLTHSSNVILIGQK